MSLFATSARRSQPVDYLRIFLTALASEEPTRHLSPEGRHYIFRATQLAAQFIQDPKNRLPVGWPEAVDLAFELRDKRPLVDEILKLKTEDDLAPELARRILSEFQHDSSGDSAAVAR
ncbi:hypothetical protein [Piscinibacter sp. HJYY11]|uniref:hypothetical protein n=1 Tax=Piscinibacter sp. HJYY11 TaxID=2801333 RepID=UPI00191EF2F8|nr:hypothetical protein [Piscinibacter sp. HJYY11]MBL0729673.1 hypothetical protein [Piscinibacter sp. HJYY11]